MIRAGLPSSDPLDPSSSSMSTHGGSTSRSHHSNTSTHIQANHGSTSSASGLAYADAQIHTPYQANPCGHVYCYVCIVGKLLSEEAAEELAEAGEDGEEMPGAWSCLRCARSVKSAQRDEAEVEEQALASSKSKEEESGISG